MAKYETETRERKPERKKKKAINTDRDKAAKDERDAQVLETNTSIVICLDKRKDTQSKIWITNNTV